MSVLLGCKHENICDHPTEAGSTGARGGSKVRIVGQARQY